MNLPMNMKLIDTNIVLRYLLNDNDELSTKAREIIDETRLDFVDCILIGYNQVERFGVHTFDKKMNKLLIGATS